MNYLKIFRLICATLIFTVFIYACGIGGDKKQVVFSDTDTIYLFDGNSFDGWTSHFAADTASMDSTWSIKNQEIHCTGTPFGFLRTITKHNNYQLNLEWKWTEKPGNSGIFIYINGMDTVWPDCMEAQLKNGNAGDIIDLGEYMKEDRGPRENWVFDRKTADMEHEAGTWNQYSIICKGVSIELYLNDTKVNSMNGLTITNGYIGLQSEGNPIAFRNIYLIKEVRQSE